MRSDRSRRPYLGLVVATALAGTVALAGATLSEARPGARTVTAAAADYDVEDDGADCPVPSTGQAPSRSLLPDPFLRPDGTRVATTSDWRCRRAEIRELAERSVYGPKPPKPAGVTGTVSSTNITVNVSDQGRSAAFSARVDLPSGSGPFPAVIVFGGLGADTSTIKAAGVAVISYDPYTVGKEGTARTGKQGAFYSVYGSSSTTGLLMAWSWGVSRIIDVIEQSDGTVLKAGATGVTGCSRFGKGAFAAGAFDQRIALTMPVESGTGGVPAYRSVPGESGAQPLSSAYSEQPWLGDAFNAYTGKPDALPVDTHEIVGMIAPRGLFIMENPHVDWLGARSGSVAALGGAEVYKALGAGGNITYWSDVQDGTHCAVRPEWKTPLQQNLSKFLLGSGSGSGVFRIAPGKAGSLAQWRDWQTPVLTGSGGTSSGASSGTTSGAGGGTSTGTGTGGSTTGGATSGGDPGGGVRTTAYRTVGSWSGGYQGEVTVAHSGTGTLGGWTVRMTLPSGQSLMSVWNGRNTGTAGTVAVRDATWNGTLGAGATTTFGYTVNGGTAAPAALTCASP